MASPWKQNYSRYKNLFISTLSQYQKRDDVKAYLELLLSLATISVFAVFALRPTLITIAQLINEIEVKKETIIKMDDKIVKLGQAQKIFEEQKENIALLNEAVPDKPNPDEVLTQFQGVSLESGILVNQLTIGESTILGDTNQTNLPEQNPQDSGSISFSLSATANYQNLFNFISFLGKLRRPPVINNVSFNTSKKDEKKTINLIISGDLPYLSKENSQKTTE